MGVLAEKLSDEKGLVWPMNTAPFIVYLATIGDVAQDADKLYDELIKAGIEVLYDDRDARPGDKFADADLMGIPYRVVISSRTLESYSVEVKPRTSEETEIVKTKDLSTFFTSKQ
jgi:prolyl-tRNA synthetase